MRFVPRAFAQKHVLSHLVQ